jgi:hypothetical protein
VKVLHVSHHQGCRHDLDYVADRLGFTLDHYEYRGGYNISAARAAAAWQTDRDRFLQYDAIVTSDTAPLSRIFLQHDWPKGLVIWVCNRFDYCDQATNDCGFPDADYYALFASAIGRRRTVVAAYTPFEHHYARTAHGIPLETLTVKPHGARLPHEFTSQVPAEVDRASSCFIPTYHNDMASDLAGRCRTLGIPAFNGRYSGPSDLRGFKAIVHVPYAWSNFALFENLQAGVPYLIPSRRMLMALMGATQFFWSPPFWTADIELSEWYTPEHRGVLACFDSWDELRELAQSDLAPRRDAIAAFCDAHTRRTLGQWRDILDRVG